MTFEENREFSADLHGMVKPLSKRYVGVVLDYWQIFMGNGSTQPGPFLSAYGFEGIDTSGQVILSPAGELLAAHRSWKTGNGFTAKELRDFAGRFRVEDAGENAGEERLKLSWFLVDPHYFQLDMGGPDKNPSGYTSAGGAVVEARRKRRPLARADGEALEILEDHQEFLRRHVRQFWWHKGDPDAPARLVVLDTWDFPEDAVATELTGRCSPGRVPGVMATVDLAAGLDLERVSPALDECWRAFMEKRPSNADNLTFAKDNVAKFKQVDELIRKLARAGRLLAPGGRRLVPREED